MKYPSFVLVLFIALLNCVVSIWEHNLSLAGAWTFGFFGCLSSLLAHLALDQERENK